jgi:23S rRNA pseudouridine2605 synthase
MPSKAPSRKIGLARALSKLGYCSRAQAVQLIRDGRVRLNGTVRRDPETPVRLESDSIAVDGQLIGAKQRIYLAMNKPRGLVTTASDEKGRETVYSILASHSAPLPWLAPVGRLDKASEGLLLLTNDSEWAARVAAPETHLPKTYHVQIDMTSADEIIQKMERGVKAETGEPLRAAHCRLLRTGEKNCWLEVVLDGGRNRQIRRMLSSLGVEVLRLVRVAIGPLQLGQLQKGTWRYLTSDEKLALDRAMAKKSAQSNSPLGRF